MSKNNLIPKIIKNLIKNEEMCACLIAGVKFEHSWKDGIYMIRTKNKVGFKRDKNNKIIEVAEMKDEV